METGGMGSLDADAYKEELFQLLVGEWKGLLPGPLYKDVVAWIKEHKNKDKVAIRIIFYEKVKSDKYAIYLVCKPRVSKGKVTVLDVHDVDKGDFSLAIPTSLYDMPLYNMPNNLIDRIFKRKQK